VLSVAAGPHHDVDTTGYQTAVSGRIEQPLDVLGQASSRRQAAGALVEAAASRLALVRLEIEARIRLAYLEAQVAIARISLGEERLAAAKRTSAAVEMRVRLGAGSDIDLRLAAAETGRAQATVTRAKADAALALLALRGALNLPADVTLKLADPLAAPDNRQPVAARPGLPAHHLAVLAVEKRRLAIDSEIVRLERERLPRLFFGVFAERPSREERMFGVALSLSPALWRRNQGPLAEARVERERTDYERSTALAELERRWATLQEAQALHQQELGTVEETLQNEETIRSLVSTGWQAGKFDFLRVLFAERSVADTRQARLELWAELSRDAIELHRLSGQEP
jgi:outer membrane protein, heavy metal efflux system